MGNSGSLLFQYFISKFKEVFIPSNSFEHLSTSQSIQLLFFLGWLGNDKKRLLIWFFLNIYQTLLFFSLILSAGTGIKFVSLS